MTRLTRAILDNSHAMISLPSYKPSEHASGIVHLGIGAFHKAHQAVYTDDVLNKFGGDWRISAVSLRNPTARDQLVSQDNLYTVVEKSDASIAYRIIGAIEKVLVAPENPTAVIELLAQASIKIVTLTITEKGYCHLNGEFDSQHPQIQQDLNNPASPTTMAGFIVAACALRRERNLAGLTIISCDNLSHNGRITRAVVLGFAELCDLELANWIRDNLTFCSTMVDRIVPATTEQDITAVKEHLDAEDQAAVICEPFRQWVIENNFCTERPRWEDAGALIVDDVTCFESMKLRLLNGSHSTLAYVGFLAGYQYIHQAIADPVLHQLVETLMDQDVTPTLHVPNGFDLADYKKIIRTRFANSLVPYKTTQVANDGSQKLPQRLLATAVELIDQGKFPIIVPFVVAAWLRFLTGVDAAGNTFTVNDPKAAELTLLARTVFSDQVQTPILRSILASVFPSELMDNEKFIHDVAFWLAEINQSGIRASVKKCLNI